MPKEAYFCTPKPYGMEHQNIEYKSQWKDEFLKEICAFANVQGK